MRSDPGWPLPALSTEQDAEVASPAVPARAPSLVAGGTLTRRNFIGSIIGGVASFVVLALGLARFRSQTSQTPPAGVESVQAAAPVPTYNKPFGPQYTSGAAASPSPAVLAGRFDPAPDTRPR